MARAPLAEQTESLPEIDRLENFPHPRETEKLFGHQEAERELAAAIASGRMHHAWLLAGPQGVGKATLAYRAAKAALSRPTDRDMLRHSLDVDQNATAARQVRALSHPGLLVIRRSWNQKDKRFPQSISVDEVRRLRSFLGHRGAEGSWRVVIVDTADELNINAANALLKSLEEPPAETVFLLVTSEPGRLLPTIRSRCRTLDLQRLNERDLEAAAGTALKAASREEPEAQSRQLLVKLAAGSVRRYLSLEAGGGRELYQEIYALIAAMPDVRWAKVHQLADTLAAPAAETRFELFFDLLLELLARLVKALAGGQGEPEEAQVAARLWRPEQLATVAEVWETVAREKAETVALNLDRKTLILRTVSRIEATTR